MEEGSPSASAAPDQKEAASSTVDWAEEERSFAADLDEAFAQPTSVPLPGFLTDTSSLDELDARLQDALQGEGSVRYHHPAWLVARV